MSTAIMLVVPGDGRDITHSELRFGNGVFMACTATHDGSNRSKPNPLPMGPYLVTPEIRTHYDHAVAGYSALDCEGYEWSSGSYGPGSTPAEASTAGAEQ